MNKALEIFVGAGAGAFTSELLVDVIKEAKKLYAFDDEFKELVSTMEQVLRIISQIEPLQDKDELKTLKDTIDEADKLVKECSAVDQWTVLVKRPYHSREIERINGKMIKFCQVQGTLIILERLSRMSVSPPVFRNYCSVPKPRKVPVGLDWPLMRLKKKLLTDSTVDSLLVSSPGGCGKTTLVTHLCHDEEINGLLSLLQSFQSLLFFLFLIILSVFYFGRALQAYLLLCCLK